MKIAAGVDIVEIDRVRSLVEKYLSDPALERIFHKDEIAYCISKGRLSMESFAARFAAKEAVAKAAIVVNFLEAIIFSKCHIHPPKIRV
jgi:holo-[acyl-carrier protein] synthase